MEIVGLPGSLQVPSSNRALLEAAALVAPPTVRVHVFDGAGDLPAFRPDLEPEPPAVGDLRSALTKADAVLIASPEYAHGVPGALKNALDWVVGSGELYRKVAAVLAASPRPDGGRFVRAHLQDTLGAQGAQLVASETIVVARGASAPALAGDPVTGPALGAVLDALVAGVFAGPPA